MNEGRDFAHAREYMERAIFGRRQTRSSRDAVRIPKETLRRILAEERADPVEFQRSVCKFVRAVLGEDAR